MPSSVSGSECGGDRVLRPAAPAADHEHRDERGDPGVDVHDGAAGEVERAAAEQPPGRREHPVRDRRVHEHRPQPDEPDPRRELHAVGDRAGDQRGRDDREHHLERRERQRRDRHRAEAGRGDRRSTSSSNARSKLPIHLPVPPNASEYTNTAQSTLDEPEAEEVLHQHREHVLGPHHAAVEQRQARRHEHHERGAHQHPRGVARVDLHRVPPPLARGRRHRVRAVREPTEMSGAAESRIAHRICQGSVRRARSTPGLGHPPREVERRELGVAQVAEVVDHEPVAVVGPRPLVEARRARPAGCPAASSTAVGSRYALRTISSGVARLLAGIEREQRVQLRFRPASPRPGPPSTRVPFGPRRASARRARPHASRMRATSRSTQPGSSRSTPATMASLDSASSREAALLLGRRRHPSMTSPSMVLTVQPTSSR